MTIISCDSIMDDYDYYEARARDVNLESITSSERNALVLEKLRDNDDSMKWMAIVDIDPDVHTFVVQEGDDLGWLGYFIGKSTVLESLSLHHLPGDKSFGQGLALNQSIQELHLCEDLGKAGFQTLAPFFQNTNTLEELHLTMLRTSLECAQNIALLLNQCQVKSLKRLVIDDNDLNGEGFEEIARALREQPQLEELDLAPSPSEDGDVVEYAALGNTMKNWTSPVLKSLRICGSDLNDDELLALVEGMANCVNLEHLYIGANGPITVTGLQALSSLFQSKKFCLQSFNVHAMNIDSEGMVTLASGLATLQSLKILDLAANAIGDEGLEALAVGLSNGNNLELLNLSHNGPFSAVGLRRLSDVIPTASNLKTLDLSGNSINDEGLQALAVGLSRHPALERLDLSRNEIGSDGLRALATTEISSLRLLNLSRNAINDGALTVVAEGVENFVSLEALNLSYNNMITSSGVAALTPIFRRESCSLKEMNLNPTMIEDSEAIAFAEALAGNQSLTKLLFNCRNLTASGWSAFSTLLWDTSSVNNIYLSNHTLEVIGGRYDSGIPSSLRQFLKLNRQNRFDVPICKILMSSLNTDMTPFFQWKLKLLPLVLAWFERAPSRVNLPDSIVNFKRRELSALYQFIRGLPLLAASGFHKQMSTDAHSKKRKFDLCDK